MAEKQRILIVDDAPANIRILGQALSSDYRLSVATNGADALEIVRSDPPDIILLDIVMPGMDGYEVCKRLKEDDLTRNIPVIFVTGKTHEEYEFRGLELGAVDYIAKPFSLPIVKARVKNHLELKRRGDLLEELAFIDGLTCIHNRRRFDEVLDQEWRRGLREGIWLTVMFIDIDFFKLFNDHYGHAAGDECLRQVAQTLKRSFSRAGDFTARYGGEEFTAVLPGTGPDGAVESAQKLRDQIASMDVKHAASPISDHVTVSIGTASVRPCEESSAKDVVKIADEMLYRAKREGRDRAESWPQEGAA
ncbi:MAG: diguanylate cyclase [Pseudomonadota bacterium]